EEEETRFGGDVRNAFIVVAATSDPHLEVVLSSDDGGLDVRDVSRNDDKEWLRCRWSDETEVLDVGEEDGRKRRVVWSVDRFRDRVT
ncbi:LOW QUALITY PROTEIN: hypothetical protein TorRG33x02_170230, partial [Trema orientale]